MLFELKLHHLMSVQQILVKLKMSYLIAKVLLLILEQMLLQVLEWMMKEVMA